MNKPDEVRSQTRSKVPCSPTAAERPKPMHLRALLVALAVCSAAPTAEAMTFKTVGDVVFAEGRIEAGDADRLSAYARPVQKEDRNSDFTVDLSSPGGSLSEGLKLGNLFRERKFSTRVRAGQSCLSACAIAFLGGTIEGVTKDGVWRTMEPGARLGFHGYSASSDRVGSTNETLEEARAVNALIFDYAGRMGILISAFCRRF